MLYARKSAGRLWNSTEFPWVVPMVYGPNPLALGKGAVQMAM